jgi:transcriptional regulator with XRE-family HTH domain
MEQKVKCRRCAGTGVEFDHKGTGAKMKMARTKAGLTLSEIGSLLKLTCAYLSDLEHGKRNWNRELIKNYRNAIRACKK